MVYPIFGEHGNVNLNNVVIVVSSETVTFIYMFSMVISIA